MQLFFNPNIHKEITEITFDKTESRHIVRVLRKKMGDILSITDGKGNLFEVEIIMDNDKKCVGKIVSQTFHKKNRNYKLHMAVAPTKNNDRFEWFLEKATEIGIDEVTPIICKNSERKVIKKDRLEKIAISAMKQSLQYYAPKVNDAIHFSEFIQKEFKGKLCIPYCGEVEKKSLKEIVLPNEDSMILIGPEGDFTPKEIELALTHNFKAITLGENRLRTETAALVSVQNIAFINQK